jgi:hypothetical protein
MAACKPDNNHDDRDDRLNAILLDYVEAVERGERPDRRRLLDSYPEFAEELGAYFATRDRLAGMAAPPRSAPAAGRGRVGTVTRSAGPTAFSRSRNSAESATSDSSARSGGAVWVSSTRPNRSHSAAAWP